jgi:hypothetical protein
MRLFGYVFLILGFVWFCFLSIAVFSEVRPLTDQQMQEISPEKQSFTRVDVYQDIRNGVFDFASELPSKFMVGAILMLGGGIILDVAGRRKLPRPVQSQATPTTADSP